jgi:serine phosphatase RsbU (regulator of sigma subunit)
VGGDWFDAFELPTGQVGVAIGDVMGHDVEAAALMAQLRAALRGFASEGDDPALVLQRLAHFMDAFSIPAIVTAIYGVLEPPGAGGSRRFRWANAGHPPPLLRQANGLVEELAEATSPVLGAPCSVPRPSGTRSLEPGSTLLFYTDGLVEVRGRDLALAVEELRTVLARADVRDADRLCATVLDTQLPSSRRDDVALLALRVEAVRTEDTDTDAFATTCTIVDTPGHAPDEE